MQNDINTNNRPPFISNSKEPQDSKSKSNSKKSENLSSSESNTFFCEEKEKEPLNSKCQLILSEKEMKRKKYFRKKYFRKKYPK